MPVRRTALPSVLLALALGLAACGADADPAAAPGTDTAAATQPDAPGDQGVRVVEPAAADELLAAEPRPTVIDVRTPAEFAEGPLEGAVLVDVQAPDFRDRIAELDRDASYVIYCRSGNRSVGARETMAELGFTDVADIDGGILAWVQAGLPVTDA